MNDVEKLENILNNYKALKVYWGQDSGCRCGCNGQYYYPDDESFVDVLTSAILNAANGAVYFGDGWVNIGYGDDMAFTIYYDDQKEED